MKMMIVTMNFPLDLNRPSENQQQTNDIICIFANESDGFDSESDRFGHWVHLKVFHLRNNFLCALPLVLPFLFHLCSQMKKQCNVFDADYFILFLLHPKRLTWSFFFDIYDRPSIQLIIKSKRKFDYGIETIFKRIKSFIFLLLFCFVFNLEMKKNNSFFFSFHYFVWIYVIFIAIFSSYIESLAWAFALVLDSFIYITLILTRITLLLSSVYIFFFLFKNTILSANVYTHAFRFHQLFCYFS